MTMEELSGETGISWQVIGKYETKRADPKLTNIIILAQALNVEINYLIGSSLKLEVKEEIVFESSINPAKK